MNSILLLVGVSSGFAHSVYSAISKSLLKNRIAEPFLLFLYINRHFPNQPSRATIARLQQAFYESEARFQALLTAAAPFRALYRQMFDRIGPHNVSSSRTRQTFSDELPLDSGFDSCHRHVGTGTGDLSLRIRRRIVSKSLLGTATSAIWKITYRACVITLAPIPQARDQLLQQRGKRPVADTFRQS